MIIREINPHPYIVFGALLLVLGFAGQLVSASVLPISLALAGLCLVVSLLGRRPFFVLLIDIWLGSYLYLFFSEYVLLRNIQLLPFGAHIVGLTEGFIVAAFGATILGYGLFIQRSFRRIPKYLSLKTNNKEAQAVSVGTSAVNLKVDETFPIAVKVVLVFLSAIVLYYVFVVLTFGQLLNAGRNQRSGTVSLGLLASFFNAAMVVYPVVIAFLWTRHKLSYVQRLSLFFVSATCILATYAVGTRFYFGFQVFGLMFFFFRGFKISRKSLVLLLSLALLVLISQSVSRATRGSGIANAELSEMIRIVANPDKYLSAEGILRVNAWIHIAEAYQSSERWLEHLFILYWWVPRELWPDKPTMAGYWVIRDLTDERGFGTGHSVSGGFAMPALLDFGPWIGPFFCITYGMILARLEAYVWQQRNRQHPGSILAGLLYFGVFFMMRSLVTSLIFLMIAIIVLVPFFLAYRTTAAAPRRAMRHPKSQRHLSISHVATTAMRTYR